MNFALFSLIIALGVAAPAAEVRVPRATYVPLFRDPGETDSVVGPLLVDVTPVTNRDFLDFLKENPKFLRSKVPALFVDEGYLKHWTGDLSFRPQEGAYPVTGVSWFMARRFCESRGKRLPTIAEWEVFSDAQNKKNEQLILEWYGKPKSALRKVGGKTGNKYGLKDAHGLIWEWVENFSEAIMSGDSRGGSSTETMFCGGAALRAKDPSLYATFMRFAYRSSLTARYTSPNLGFRCVKDADVEKK